MCCPENNLAQDEGILGQHTSPVELTIKLRSPSTLAPFGGEIRARRLSDLVLLAAKVDYLFGKRKWNSFVMLEMH